MKTKLIALTVGLLLVVGASVAIPAEPAEAHNYDDPSEYLCAALRPGGTVLFHSWPYWMASGKVRYWCVSGFVFGDFFQYFIEWNQPAGTAYLISGYQECIRPNDPDGGGIVHCAGYGGHP